MTRLDGILDMIEFFGRLIVRKLRGHGRCRWRISSDGLLSDPRRGFVICVSLSKDFWLGL
jgi:hypothetical protein